MEKILVICDDLWHTGELVQRGFSCMEKRQERLDFVMDARDMLEPEDLAQYALVICCKGNNLTAGNGYPWFEEGVTEVGPCELRRYVEEGGGFLAIHAGNSFSEKDCPPDGIHQRPCGEYISFVGNRFLMHPPRCAVSYKILAPEHTIMRGVEDFEVRDEHYQIEMVADDAQILMSASSRTGEDMPGCYVREMGRGRLCAIMPGHNLSVWKNPHFQRLVGNAIDWCMRK